ncbi:MAG TPA: SLC13 family permease [Phycisphaerales bacterium]|nr:SLC13 family permease [Phycisphaerales bacterium]HRQ75917.1 SLC13 family permease [Phycisphaerales bacterium]
MSDVWIVFAVLAGALVLFVGGWWRYDIVAMLALLALTIVGVVPAADAFSGFGHPAVITVAAVLVLSRGLINSGVVNPLARTLSSIGDRPFLQVAALTGIVTLCSGFMNNVGALALFMPVAIAMARKSGRSPSMLLMPLAFGSLLGGMITLIGTPPNIIIATFRRQATEGGEAFRMFDFAPVGVAVALAGVAFIALIGWRLVPRRQAQTSPEELFDISEYLVEVRVPDKSKFIGKSIADLGKMTDGEAIVIGLYRQTRRIAAPSIYERLAAGDVLTIEIDPDSLQTLLEQSGFELAGKGKSDEKSGRTVSSDEIKIAEAVISPSSVMLNASAESMRLRSRHGMNLLAVARQGKRLKGPLRRIRFQAGDIVLVQAEASSLHETLNTLGCLPLADRELQLGRPRRIIPALGIFLAALAISAIGWLPVQIAFAAAALLMVATKLVSLEGAYRAIDWPVIVLLAAMIPVGAAMETTGGAAMAANSLLRFSEHLSPTMMLIILLLGTMFLSDLINNAAAAVLMAPIAISLSKGLGASADPFLMAVAIGASCAFLTPIGHQSNTIVMGPGGYRFGDYWRLGLPLEIVIAIVSVPMILWVWPIGLD